MRKWTRRAFIGAGSLVGGGFVLGIAGVTFAPRRHGVVSADAEEMGELTTWITVTPDDLVTILVPRCEMGQGSLTALAMMAAEEMEADWDRVRIREAPVLDMYANAYLLRAFTGDGVPFGPRHRLRGLSSGPLVRNAGHRRVHRGLTAGTTSATRVWPR